MNTEYKFLILEDVETDVELIMDQVQAADINCQFVTTDNEDGFIKLMVEFKPDLILADYSLPTYDGMSALKYVLTHSPETPVVMVTGSINEETAVKCMKSGAVDYILKDKMERLGLAVRVALSNKKIRQDKIKVEKDLVKRELYYRNILKYMHDEIVVISKDYIIEDINNSVLTVIGKKRKEILGTTCYQTLYGCDSPCYNFGIECPHEKVFSTGLRYQYQRKARDTTGKEIWVDIMTSPLFDENKNVTHIIESYRNVTDLIRIKESERRLLQVVKQSPVSVIVMDKNRKVLYVNDAFTNLNGYTKDEIIGTELESIGDFSIAEDNNLYNQVLNGENVKSVFYNRKKDGTEYWVSAVLAPFFNSEGYITGLIEIQEDITKRLEDEKQIAKDLEEKELLLQEIYHRVNNNMQIMISLLNIQIDNTDSAGEKKGLITAQSRIGAISAIHNNIYQEKSFTDINFNKVVNNIYNNLCVNLMIFQGNIKFSVNADISHFGLDLAQPCALIVNELLSNCLCHAFPNGNGKIEVDLNIDDSGEITLQVKDNGIGIPEDVDLEKSETTGFSLIYLLVSGQLGGTVKFIRNKGTTVEISFKRIIDKKRF